MTYWVAELMKNLFPYALVFGALVIAFFVAHFIFADVYVDCYSNCPTNTDCGGDWSSCNTTLDLMCQMRGYTK